MSVIFHITSHDEWQQAMDRGWYEAPSLASAGFIHCSDRHQVSRVANHIFRHQTGLILLHIDTEQLISRVVYENLDGGYEAFPHIYGPINTNAVMTVTPFEPAQDGSFDHHALKTDFP